LCYLEPGRLTQGGVVGDEARGHDDLVRDGDDHDLLTFSEGGIRLREEITLIEAALRENPTDALRARLAALTNALERNTRQAAANPGDTGFLDYTPPGQARRGTAGGGRP
jgi:hypothetical protein